VRALKEVVLHKLQFFVELLHGGVYGAEFVEQSQTPPKTLLSGTIATPPPHLL